MVGLGVMGCGSVARAYMEPIKRLQAAGLAAPVACCDALPERAREYADRYGVPRTVATLDEMLAMDEVQAVLVLTPNRFHPGMAAAALAAGRHVLLEKPMATDLAAARALVAAARASTAYLVCPPAVVLSPTFAAMAARLQQGDLGRLYSARAIYGWAGPDWAEWFYKADAGPLLDLGVYDLTALTGLLGPARRVTCLAGLCVPERLVEGRTIQVEAADNLHLLLDFGGGLLASLFTGYTIQRQRTPALEVYGERGVMQMLGHTWGPQGYELWTNEAGCWRLFDETAPGWPWTAGLDHLVECIYTGRPPLMRPEHALHVTEIMLQALQSARLGTAVDLQTTFQPLPPPS